MRALLLDRDGVVNVDHGYVGAVEQFEFRDGIFELARDAGLVGHHGDPPAGVDGIAGGYYDEAQFQALTAWMCREFERRGAGLAAVLHCPYHPCGTVAAYARESFWRKPGAGMLLEAQRRLGFDPSRSIMVGDQPTDMAAARAAGIGLRVLLADRMAGTPEGADADVVVPDVPRFADLVRAFAGREPVL